MTMEDKFEKKPKVKCQGCIFVAKREKDGKEFVKTGICDCKDGIWYKSVVSYDFLRFCEFRKSQ